MWDAYLYTTLNLYTQHCVQVSRLQVPPQSVPEQRMKWSHAIEITYGKDRIYFTSKTKYSFLVLRNLEAEFTSPPPGVRTNNDRDYPGIVNFSYFVHK